MTRAETIKWLSNLKMDIGKTQHQELWHYEQALDEIIKVLEQAPKRSKWILGKREWEDNYTFSCSQCWHSIVTPKTQKIPYCWFCGAKMEVEE